MARATAFLSILALVCGVVTFFQGMRVGHGEGTLLAHLYWGFATLALQAFAAGVAFVHARVRASERSATG